MKKNLESTFTKAQSLRNSEPLHSSEELRGILQESTGSHHDFKNHNTRSFIMKIIGIVVLAGLSGMAVLWTGFGGEKEKIAFKKEIVINHSLLKAPVTNEIPAKKPDSKISEIKRKKVVQTVVGNLNKSEDQISSDPESDKSEQTTVDTIETVSNEDIVSTDLPTDSLNPQKKHFSKEGFVLTPENGTIRGIRYMELTDDELEKLGIEKTDDGYEYFTEQKKLGILFRVKNTLDTFGLKIPGVFDFRMIPFGEEAKIRMVAVTQQTAGDETRPHGSMISVITSSEEDRPLVNEFSTMQDEHEQSRWHPKEDARLIGSPSEKYPLMSKMIPVYTYFKSIDKETGIERNISDVTFWFKPSPEFIAALPERYRTPLETEMKILKGIEQKEITPEDACEIIKGEPTFFDLCRTGSGAIRELAVYPNPAVADSKCRFILSESRKVQITLHSTDGRLLKDISPSGEMKAGEHQIPLQLSGVKSGAYLIAVTTERGEQAVYRIIVQ